MNFYLMGPRFQSKTLRFVLLQSLVFFLCLPASQAEIKARLTVSLCPEFQLGGMRIKVKYKVGDSPAPIDAPVDKITVNKDDTLAIVETRLPSGFANTPINVYTHCVNKSRGQSDPSNIVKVNNCQRLSLIDSDSDGFADIEEDTNCDNNYSLGDRSNARNIDTDGDGVTDLVEGLLGYDAANAGSSPRPKIFSDAPFDPDIDGSSNALAWRISSGTWFIKDVGTPGNHVSFQFGLPGDIPFTYQPAGGLADVGVVRTDKFGNLTWYFNGIGFELEDGNRLNQLSFGGFGDNHIVSGPWEISGVTNPAIATQFPATYWSFFIFMRDGTVFHRFWGRSGDTPKVQDYDGDGIFDIAVYRRADRKIHLIRSSDGEVMRIELGTGTSDASFRGDVTGDGTDDAVFWEPSEGVFTYLKGDKGFEGKDSWMKLGLFGVHLPFSWNARDGEVMLSVIDHATGMRYWRQNNDRRGKIIFETWGQAGDALG